MSSDAQVEQTVSVIRKTTRDAPTIGIILGTGLTRLLKQVQRPVPLPYERLPHMPRSTAPTHRGQLVFGTLAGASVAVMDGRFHLYEGYTAQQVAYPVRVLRRLGITTLLVSNVAGGLNPAFSIGDLMVITDHINLLGTSPLVGPNEDAFGVRFPDMSQPYDAELIRVAEQIGRREGLPVRTGVYVAMLGPQLETKAEYRWLRGIGADAVGMSTVPEVIAAVHAGLRVFAASIISDLCIPETLKPVNIEAIIRVADTAEPLLTRLMARLVEFIGGGRPASAPAAARRSKSPASRRR